MFNKQLSEAIRDHACSMDGLTAHLKEEFEWRRSHHGLATKQDLANAKAEIIKALGERLSPGKLGQLKDTLKESADPLAAAVADNTPKISG